MKKQKREMLMRYNIEYQISGKILNPNFLIEVNITEKIVYVYLKSFCSFITELTFSKLTIHGLPIRTSW